MVISSELGELAIHQRTEGALLVSHNPGRDISRESFERGLCVIESRGLDVSECCNVLVHELFPVRCSLAWRNEAGVMEVHQCRLECAPSEVDDQGFDAHKLARELGQTGDLLDEVILVEAVRSSLC